MVRIKNATKSNAVWKTVRNSPKDVEKAAIKARILTGTYTLQANRSKFNQYTLDPTCLICGKGIENRKHFILLCPVTEIARAKFKQKIIDRMNSSTVTHLYVQNDDILLQIIVDCSALIVGPQYSDLRQWSGDIKQRINIQCTCSLHSVDDLYAHARMNFILTFLTLLS